MWVRIFFVAGLLMFTCLLKCMAQGTELKFNLVEGPGGKPLGKVNSIAQDPHGYMWFAGSGAKCLYRYDGNRFVVFRHDDNNQNTLGGTSILSVYADKAGLIWIGMVEGLDRYDPATGIFSHYRNVAQEPGSLSKGSHTIPILRDRKGRLWVGTDEGLDQLDEATGKFIHHRNEPNDPRSLSSNFVWSIYEDRQGVLWVGTGDPFFNRDPNNGGLNRLNADGSFTRYLNDPKDAHSLANNKVAAMFEDSRGVFWVGTGGDGLHTMDRRTGRFERHPYDPKVPDQLSCPPLKPGEVNDKITFITEDCMGEVWIGTMYSGINRYDTATKTVTHFEGSHGFPDSSGWNAFNSRDGVLWICSENSNLLYRVDPFRKDITNVHAPAAARNLLEDDQGYIWVGTQGGGLLQYDQGLQIVRQFKHVPKDSASLPSDTVAVVFQNEDGKIWVKTTQSLRMLDTATKRLSRFSAEEGFTVFDTSAATNVFRDSKGIIWVGRWANGGLIRFDPKRHVIKHYISRKGDPATLLSNNIGQIFEDRSGMIWTGSDEGWNRLDDRTGKITRYSLGNGIWTLHVFMDSEGEIWGGAQNGLYKYDEAEDRFKPFYEQQSEMNAMGVGGMVEDEFKNLWFFTHSAIIRLNLLTMQTMMYGSKYGVQHNSMEVWKRAYKNRAGRIFIPCDNGFYTFTPGELKVKTDLTVIITDLLINSIPVSPGQGSPLKTPVEAASELNLAYDQDNVAFNFSMVDYRKPESTRYFTMLENYDNNWREAIGGKSSDYFHLTPGRYVFRVKAFNSDGAKEERIINIRINPPWWRTWWAYGLYALILGFVVYAVYRNQRRRIIDREREKSQQIELAQAKEIEKAYHELRSTQAQLIQSEKMASLGELTAGIAHEIQNPLNFVNNFSDINADLIEEAIAEMGTGNIPEAKELLESIRENEKKIRTHGGRADAIVKSMLQHSRTSTGQKEPTDINALADEYLKLTYQGLRARDKAFQATLIADFDSWVERVPVVPQDIGRVLLNLYNNAFYAVSARKMKEGDGFVPTVSVRTKKVGKMIELSVVDNGFGIPAKIREKIFQPFFTTKPTGEGTGLGLSLSYDIIKAHGGEMRVESAEGEGTTMHVILPA